jgi:hypothetical protein
MNIRIQDCFAIDGVLGTDFLLEVGAVIDLAALRVYGAND